jgi:hypothetical protein
MVGALELQHDITGTIACELLVGQGGAGDIVAYSPVPYEKHCQAASCTGLLTPWVSSNNLRIVSNARRKALLVSSLSGTKLNS